jgi:hypothetical protein
MSSPVAELLADLAAAFDQRRVDWYLFGAQAAILHGAARLTADVDVTVRLPEAFSNAAGRRGPLTRPISNLTHTDESFILTM